MHSPLSMHDDAHLMEASGPAPARATSRIPPTISLGFESEIPAGRTLGHTSTHLPHFVHAPSMYSTRSLSAVAKDTSFIGRDPFGHYTGFKTHKRQGRQLTAWVKSRHCNATKDVR